MPTQTLPRPVTRMLLAALLVSPSLAAQTQQPVPATPAPETTPAQTPAPVATPPATPASDQAAPAPTPPPAPVVPADSVANEFDALDRDGDGKVSANEHAEGAKATFDALDADSNYHVSAQEMDRANRGQAVADQISGAERIAPMDANGNGEISPDESRAEAEASFRSRDANRDGSLSLEEMRGASAEPAPPPGN